MSKYIRRLKLYEKKKYINYKKSITNILQNTLCTDIIKHEILPFFRDPIEIIDKWYNLFKLFHRSNNFVFFNVMSTKQYESIKYLFRKSVVNIKDVYEFNICIDVYNIVCKHIIKNDKGFLVHARAPIEIVSGFFKQKGETTHQIYYIN